MVKQSTDYTTLSNQSTAAKEHYEQLQKQHVTHLTRLEIKALSVKLEDTFIESIHRISSILFFSSTPSEPTEADVHLLIQRIITNNDHLFMHFFDTSVDKFVEK